jgi:hypothetical protein
MERRYLVAAVAIIATFAGFSHGFRSLQHLSLLHAERLGAAAKLKGDATSAARAMAKIGTHLRPGYPEEAQLLAEMDVPIAGIEAKVAEQMAHRDVAAAQCARAAAMREAEHARRDATRMRDKMLRAYPEAAPTPISFEVNLPDGANRRIAVNMAALKSRLAAQQVRLQIAANRLQVASVRIAESDVSVIDTDADQDSRREAIHAGCNDTSSWQRQTRRSAREAARDARASE